MKEIPLTKGYVAIVDDEDADLAEFKWHASIKKTGAAYAHRAIFISGKKHYIAMHRLILERKLGCSLERATFTDHKDGNSLNNVRSNLRPATRTQNARNRKLAKNSTSGMKGANYQPKYNTWKSTIRINGKVKHLGTFCTAEEAVEAYRKAAKEAHGEFARFE